MYIYIYIYIIELKIIYNMYHVIQLLHNVSLLCIGPIASIFWLDEELGCDVFLDG